MTEAPRTGAEPPTAPVRAGAVALVALGLVAVLALVSTTTATAYDYPIKDGYLATIVGTASEDAIEISEDVPLRVRSILPFPNRDFPAAFAYRSRFRYSLASQTTPAPLAFVLAGTGSSFRSDKVVALQRVLYDAGFHVVGVSSTTHPDFMISASRSAMPGRASTDAREVYETLGRIREDIEDEVEITGYHLTGFSLGATHSAFIAELDKRERRFDFERVLLVNPSVDLFASTQAIDALVDAGLPEGGSSFDDLVTGLLTEVAAYVHSRGREPLDNELLYRIAEMRIAENRPPRAETLYAIIGAVFRVSAAGMIFTADALHGGGHVIPAGAEITRATSLTDSFKRAARWPFVRYLDEMLLPYWQAREPALDRDALIADASLRSIAGFLDTAEHVGVVTNDDDFIVSDEDRQFLSSTFGERARIYSDGGHGGNLLFRENAEFIRDFFVGPSAAPGHAPSAGATAAASVRPSARPAAAGMLPVATSAGDTAARVQLAVAPTAVIDWGEAPAATGSLEDIGETPIDRFDPLEKLNRHIYRFNAGFDRWVFLPVLKVWHAVLPRPVRRGFSNLLANLDEITTLANSMLQLEPKKSFGTIGRFVVNSTVGIAGLWDPATKIGLGRYSEDFGQTLGHYGMGAGPYLVLPVMGPSSLRDSVGSIADRSLLLFTLNAASGDWVEENTWVQIPESIQARDDIAFRYDELGSPFEYDLMRYLYLEYRDLQVQN